MKHVISFCTVIFSCTALFFSAQPIVIIIHGSFASTTSWPQPDGAFFKEIEHQAHELGQKTITFCWSGIPTDQEIIKGGKMLAQLITSYPDNEKIITIGHSHGGNVINIASQLLYKLTSHEAPTVQADVSSIVLEVPLIVTTTDLHLLTTTRTGSQAQNLAHQLIINEEEPFQNLMNQAFEELSSFSAKFLTRSNVDYPIDFSYLLGTPVNMGKFWPHMETIKKMILLYSDGDMIQPVLGMFEKSYPHHDRRANVKVKLYTSGQSCKAPSHTDLHHPTIGRWLLCIPNILTQLKIGNFNQFRFGTDGVINFYSEQEPNYCA